MTRFETKSGEGPGRTRGLTKTLQARRRAFERQALGLPGVDKIADGVVSQPMVGVGLLLCVLFAVVATLLVWWTRGQPLAAPGRIMDHTALVRVAQLVTVDEVLTRQARENARQSTPRVFVANDGPIDAAVAAIEALPATVAGARELLDVDPQIAAQFELTPELLEAIRGATAGDEGRVMWERSAQELGRLLRARPLVDKQLYQRSLQEGTHSTIVLTSEGVARATVLRGEMVDVTDLAMVRRVMDSLARDAGFGQPLRTAVVARLLGIGEATYSLDNAATSSAQAQAASQVQPVEVRVPAGEVIFRRGEALTPAQHELHRQELAAHRHDRDVLETAMEWAAVGAACAGVTAALAAYAAIFAPGLARRGGRVIATVALMGGGLGVACAGAAMAPAFIAAWAVLPTVFVALLITIGHGRRAALAFGLMHGLLVCLALRQDVATLGVIVAGVGCVVTTLREVRDRKSLVRTTIVTGLGLGTAIIVFGVLTRPVDVATLPVLRELAVDAALAALGTLGVGGLTLFALPLIEKIFSVTTGMTLTELRDPKQPLLRELQVRAPGTYTHSLNVATIAEAAADAIGADGLLTYVGALYHDVGKMNKPEYFIENQTGGSNKHDKLSPAMSLLIVVGHVKDGMELAREFRLPAMIQHFIEAHHGTTLVEYFYHRATQRAIAEAAREHHVDPDELVPDEFEYRYPGPRPRTKEVAILMIADACESAVRAMRDPSPAKIDAFVRELAAKRLRDGQFDECAITLRELAEITESVIRTLTSMYHGRVAYPGGVEGQASPTPATDASTTNTEPKPAPRMAAN